MALVTNKKIVPPISVNDSEQLKKSLSDKQLASAKKMYFDIRKSFFDAGCPMTRQDQELAELIRLKILDVILAEEF